jgi:hypothetical protein
MGKISLPVSIYFTLVAESEIFTSQVLPESAEDSERHSNELSVISKIKFVLS